MQTLTPEAAGCAPGEAVLLQSSELVEDVDVGVMGTAVVLLPEKLGIGIKNKYFSDREERKLKKNPTTKNQDSYKLLQLHFRIFYIYRSMPLIYLYS